MYVSTFMNVVFVNLFRTQLYASKELILLLQSEKVEQLLLESNANCSIISDNLKKVYPGRDGNPPKFAVKGLSLAVPRGECFGMLGPNGAGKTSFISMVSVLCNFSSTIMNLIQRVKGWGSSKL